MLPSDKSAEGVKLTLRVNGGVSDILKGNTAVASGVKWIPFSCVALSTSPVFDCSFSSGAPARSCNLKIDNI